MNAHPSNPLIPNMYKDFNKQYNQYEQDENNDEDDTSHIKEDNEFDPD